MVAFFFVAFFNCVLEDFSCKRALLLREMKYFQSYLVGVSAIREIKWAGGRVSVACIREPVAVLTSLLIEVLLYPRRRVFMPIESCVFLSSDACFYHVIRDVFGAGGVHQCKRASSGFVCHRRRVFLCR